MMEQRPERPSADGEVGGCIARRIRQWRAEHKLTLDDLARRSGVSRAMISRIERGEASPTAALLARLSSSLGYGLSAFFAEDGDGPPEPLARRADQPEWRDPDTGYTRRNVSPRGTSAPMEVAEIVLPAGSCVLLDNRAPWPVAQFVWLLDGMLVAEQDGAEHVLDSGDCLHTRLDAPLALRNPGPSAARYAVVVEVPRTPVGAPR